MPTGTATTVAWKSVNSVKRANSAPTPMNPTMTTVVAMRAISAMNNSERIVTMKSRILYHLLNHVTNDQ